MAQKVSAFPGKVPMTVDLSTGNLEEQLVQASAFSSVTIIDLSSVVQAPPGTDTGEVVAIGRGKVNVVAGSGVTLTVLRLQGQVILFR